MPSEDIDPMSVLTRGAWYQSTDVLNRATAGYVRGWVLLIRTEILRLVSGIKRIISFDSGI